MFSKNKIKTSSRDAEAEGMPVKDPPMGHDEDKLLAYDCRFEIRLLRIPSEVFYKFDFLEVCCCGALAP